MIMEAVSHQPDSAGTLIPGSRENNITSSKLSSQGWPQHKADNLLERDGLENQLVRHVERDLSDQSTATSRAKREAEFENQSGPRSDHYSEVFAYREPQVAAKERIIRESPITVEVKTNVIVKDEYTFMTDFSEHLVQRYQRPSTSILIHLDHSTCLAFGGSFDPAYFLTITALPSYVQPTTNKRNASLIQTFIAESLRVPISRGVVRFVAIPEENIATNGMTISGQVENLKQKASKDNARNMETKTSKNMPQHSSTFKPPKELTSRKGSQSGGPNKAGLLPAEIPPLPPLPTEISAMDKQAEKARKVSKRKSLMNMFGR